MSEFINTIDLIGDEAVLDSILEGNITEFNDNVIKSIRSSAFSRCYSLITVDLPAITTKLGGYTFRDAESLLNLNIPNVTEISNYEFLGCKKLSVLDCPKVTVIGIASFQDSAIETLILRSEEVCTLKNINSFNSTPILAKTGYIYVPRILIDSYKTATNWSTLADQFRAIEDYTFEGTVNGKFKETVYQILDRSISGHYENDQFTTIRGYSFKDCKKLTSVNFANVTSVGRAGFVECSALEYAHLPLTTVIESQVFQNCTALKKVDTGAKLRIENSSLGGCTSLEALILRSETLCTLVNTGAFTNTSIANGTGYIYVPKALVDSYKAETNWSTYAEQIRAIEDYPEICGGDN